MTCANKFYRDGNLIETCLDQFKKDDLKVLATLHKERLVYHIERRIAYLIRDGNRAGLEHFIRAATNSRGRI